MRIEKSQNENREQNQSQTSFNVSLFVKNNRKNRRKCKKIIHNCCVLVKKQDGSQQIILRQFVSSCRLKTAKCLAKKAKQMQAQKDQQVSKELIAQIKSFSCEKQLTNNFQSQKTLMIQPYTQEKQTNLSQETVISQAPMPTLFYYVPNFYNFQIV